MMDLVGGESEARNAHLTSPPRPRHVLRLGLALTTVIVAVAIALSWRGTKQPDPARVLPAWHQVAEFSLTERDGRTVTLGDLRGKVWLANFVFTRCSGPCPELSLRMHSVQRGVEKLGADVMLVTFSLDPEYDTPAVLEAYAKRFNAEPARWWFLTGGSQPQMHALIRGGFLQPVVGGGDAPLDHSTYFVLVDRAGSIRAFYPGLEPESKAAIVRDIEALLSEQGPS